MQRVYFDNNATTPVLPEVFEADWLRPSEINRLCPDRTWLPLLDGADPR